MNTPQLTQLAGRIRAWLETNSIRIKHSQSLDLSAAIVGLRNWPEVQAFPDQVREAKLDLEAAGRLCRRLQSKYSHTADPLMLLATLEQAVAPATTGVRARQRLTIERLAGAWLSVAASQGLESVPTTDHVATLLAAALGYDSLERYEAAVDEARDLSVSKYWIVDTSGTLARIGQHGLELAQEEFFACLRRALRDAGGPTLCVYPWDLTGELQPLVDEAVVEDGHVSGQMATTNCAGPFYTSLEIDFVEDALPPPGDELVIDYSGAVNANEHHDAPFCGDTVDVTGTVTMAMVGRRLFGAARIEVLSAELDWSWAAGDQEAEEEGRTFSRKEALARELDLTDDQAEFVEDAEITQATTSAGVPNGYLVDITNCGPGEIVEQLVQQHGSSQIWVLGTAFDHLAPDYS